MRHNVTGLCVRWRLEALHFQKAMKMNRITTYQITTEPSLTQNPCYINVCLAGQKKRWLAGSLAFVSLGVCAFATKDNVLANCVDKLNIEE